MDLGGDRRLMTMHETAEYLSTSEANLRNHYRPWGLKAIKVGRRVKFRVSDVERWIAEHRV